MAGLTETLNRHTASTGSSTVHSEAYTFRKASGVDPHVLIPAALENQITAANVSRIHGVTCSYFEQVQGNSNYFWSRDEVLHKLDSWMTEAYGAIHTRAEREQVSLRDAAYLIAVDRVARACRKRGWV